MNDVTGSSARVTWSAAVAFLSATTLLAFFGPLADRVWEQPRLLFGLVVVTAGVCVIGATIVIALADRREMAEVGLLGAALMAASVVPLVHGLITPSVLFDQTEAFRTTTFLSIPMAVAAAAPLLSPRSAFGRWAARHWRDWTLLSVLGVFVVVTIIVFAPDAIVAPEPSSPVTLALSAATVAALGALSMRQLTFYELGRRPSNLVAALSLVTLAIGALLPVVPTEYSPAYWWLHVAVAAGVLGACVALVVSLQMSPSAMDILAPILVRDPLAAFELGLSPTVHRFVADLDTKDSVTRDHVVRTAEMALRLGERFHLRGHDLRNLGLAGLLHDVGKLDVPDEILEKPGPLTSEEYEIVKTHVVEGAEMLRADPSLESAADIVRSHHEHVDGGGYPDGLVGNEIPLAARIIAVCDAFDAMTHDHHYRTGMPTEVAFAILNERAGTQWDPEVIRRLVTMLPSIADANALDGVGRRATDGAASALTPDDIRVLLATVDAQI